MKYTTVLYTLFYKPNGQFPCKRNYLHKAKSDEEAIALAEEFVKKKNATIYRLNKESQEVEDIDLILND